MGGVLFQDIVPLGAPDFDLKLSVTIKPGVVNRLDMDDPA